MSATLPAYAWVVPCLRKGLLAQANVSTWPGDECFASD